MIQIIASNSLREVIELANEAKVTRDLIINMLFTCGLYQLIYYGK